MFSAWKRRASAWIVSSLLALPITGFYADSEAIETREEKHESAKKSNCRRSRLEHGLTIQLIDNGCSFTAISTSVWLGIEVFN